MCLRGSHRGAPLHPSLGRGLPLPSCWRATSWRGGLPLQLDIPRSPAPGPADCAALPCSPFSPSPPCLQSSHLISEQLITKPQSWLDRNERVVRDPNVILMALFRSGVVVIYFSAHSSNVPPKSKPFSQ